MRYITIKNKKGTSDKELPSGYTSWLGFWESKKGKKAEKCLVRFCNGNADVGGHVIKAGEGNKEYILPMCYSCNNKPSGTEFETEESNLVSVK